MKIAFLLYPTTGIKIDEDSSFWIMFELKKRGHEVFYFESKDLFWAKKAPYAYLRPTKLEAKRGYLPSPQRRDAADLSGFDCIFIRKEPPFDQGYLYALQLLGLIREKVFILNDPQGIAMANEKIFPLLFPGYCSESLVTENALEAKKFIRNLRKKVVVKPLDEKGGKGIFSTYSGDKNLSSFLEIATDFGKRKVIVQRFIEAAHHGDKRILILNGRALGAFGRKPPRDDFRANLSIGGSMYKSPLSRWDLELVEAIKRPLLESGLWFVGVDVIGKYITEINVTSPAGIPEINYFNKTHLEQQVADFIETEEKVFRASRI